MSNTWEKELRAELEGDEPFAEEVGPEEPAPEPKKSFSGVFLTSLVFLMMIFIGVAVYQKDPEIFSNWRKSEPKAEAVAPVAPLVDTRPQFVDNSAQLAEIMAELRRIKATQGELKSEMEVLGKRVKIQGDRITILGTITNDNAMGTRNGDRDPLYLNPDWTLPRQPRYLQPTGADADFIRENVKPSR